MPWPAAQAGRITSGRRYSYIRTFADGVRSRDSTTPFTPLPIHRIPSFFLPVAIFLVPALRGKRGDLACGNSANCLAELKRYEHVPDWWFPIHGVLAMPSTTHMDGPTMGRDLPVPLPYRPLSLSFLPSHLPLAGDGGNRSATLLLCTTHTQRCHYTQHTPRFPPACLPTPDPPPHAILADYTEFQQHAHCTSGRRCLFDTPHAAGVPTMRIWFLTTFAIG